MGAEENFLPETLTLEWHGFGAELFTFKWVEGELLFSHSDCGAHFQTRRVQPALEAWRDFWVEIRCLGVWYWRREYRHALCVLDGVQWKLSLALGDKRMTAIGDNAFPPDGRDEPSELFKQLLRAFGRLASDEAFIRYWYYGEERVIEIEERNSS